MDRVVGIRVEQFLAEADMAAAEPIAGRGGLDKIITKANIYADMDILEWVAAKEILLMTEKNLLDWSASALEDLIRICVHKELAALAFKAKDASAYFLPEIKALADELNFPLIHLPKELAIADVSALIFRLLYMQQAETLEKHGIIHEQLLLSLLEDGKIEAVLSIIQQHVGNPLAFRFSDFGEPMLVSNLDSGTNEQLLEDLLAYRMKYSDSTKADEKETVIAGKKYSRIALPVMYKKNNFGTLFSWGINSPMNGFTLFSMETAATNIALLLLQERSLQEIEIKHSSEYFDELLHPQTRDEALEKARIYQLNADNQFCLLILRFCELAPPTAGLIGEGKSIGSGEQGDAERKQMDQLKRMRKHREFIYDFIAHNLKWTEKIMKAHVLTGLLSTKKNEIRLLIDVEKMHGDREPLERFARELQGTYEKLWTSDKEIRIQAGIGKAYAGLANMSQSYKEASKTIDLGIHLYEHKVLHFSDLGIFKIFIHVTDDGELEEFYRDTLTPLLAYEKRKQVQMLATLEAYFANNGSITKTSEVLYTHYNTVLYRIERIQEITGMNLNNPNDRLNLELALKLRCLFT